MSVARTHSSPTTTPWFRASPDSTIVADMGCRILVADDEPHIRGVVRAYLEREATKSSRPENGEAASNTVRRQGWIAGFWT